MPDSDEFWDFYWELRLQELEDLGKREAILEVSKLIRGFILQNFKSVRLLEMGCGEGQIIGPLVEAHSEICSVNACVGVDYKPQAIEKCRHAYPNMQFLVGDFTGPDLLASLEQFEIVMLVNALHEVFSSGYSRDLGEVDVPAAKHRVEQAIAGAASKIIPGGYLLIFDGLEPPGDLQETMRVRFRHQKAREHFNIFAREYHPFRISYREMGDPYCIELSRRDFTRYITKSIFLGKQLWQTERLESYQYYTEEEFRTVLKNQGLEIRDLRTLTVDYENWSELVEIETPGADFPVEHILILAQKKR
jgi:SAM-dependent methyltransferase